MAYTFRQAIPRKKPISSSDLILDGLHHEVWKFQVNGAWVPLVEVATVTVAEMNHLALMMGIATSFVRAPGGLSKPKAMKVLWAKLKNGVNWEDAAGVYAKYDTYFTYFLNRLQAGLDLYAMNPGNSAVQVRLMAPGNNLSATPVKVGRKKWKTGHCGCPRTDVIFSKA